LKKSNFLFVIIDNRKKQIRQETDGRNKHLDTFDNEIDAAKTYDRTARKYFAQFAITNFADANRGLEQGYPV